MGRDLSIQLPIDLKTTYRLAVVLLLALLVGLGILLTTKLNLLQKQAQFSSDVILEQIEEAQKIITCEGYFTEVLSYKDYYSVDWWPLRKKALIRVKGRASVGYDIEKFVFEIDEANQRLIIESIPSPELLSLEHDMDYYDISEGTFNRFSEADFNTLNQQAKNLLKAQVDKSELYPFAEQKLMDYLRNITQMAELGDWTIIYPGGQPEV